MERQLNKKENIYYGSKEKVKDDVKGFIKFLAFREFGYRLRDLVIKFGMTQAGVGYAVIRGKGIAKVKIYQFKRIELGI